MIKSLINHYNIKIYILNNFSLHTRKHPMRQIAHAREHHWHFSPISPPWPANDYSNGRKFPNFKSEYMEKTRSKLSTDLRGLSNLYHLPFWVMWLKPRLPVKGSESSRRDLAWFKSYFSLFACAFARKKLLQRDDWVVQRSEQSHHVISRVQKTN